MASKHQHIAPWPYYEADEIEAATQTLQTGKVNYWTGHLVKDFEAAYAEYVGANYAIAVSNGTVALELALRAFNVGPGDEVIVASRSYVASASCVLIVGATPVFADVDLDSGNITAATIKPLITNATKAIIPVHVGGFPCDMPQIMSLAKQSSIKVIEDCAQAHGASVLGKPVGAWGDAAIFSFCQDKIISTGGEGGMLLISEKLAYKKAWAYKDVGRSYDAVFNTEHQEGFRWLTETAGNNYRMTEFQAAIGIKQLQKLNRWVSKRAEHAKAILNILERYDFLEIPQLGLSQYRHAYYRVYVKVKPDVEVLGCKGSKLRNMIIRRLEDSGVPSFVGSCAEVYREKAFKKFAPKVRLVNAVVFSDDALCFLTHHTITAQQITLMQENIIAALNGLE